MKYAKHWEKFFQTGNIKDYLDYTACSLEEAQLELAEREGEYSDNDYTYGNGFNSDAHWRI